MIYEGAVIGKQIILYSTLAVFSFETEAQCEMASKLLHKDEYVEGSCWKSFEYVLPRPLRRPSIINEMEVSNE